MLRVHLPSWSLPLVAVHCFRMRPDQGCELQVSRLRSFQVPKSKARPQHMQRSHQEIEVVLREFTVFDV